MTAVTAVDVERGHLGLRPKTKAREPQWEMMMPLLLNFSRKALNNVDDVAGRWQYEAGTVAQDGKHVANYACVRRVTFHGTDQDGQNAASATTTIFFLGSAPPESITLEGAHDFSSGNETGSVSAASNSQSARIGKQFTRTGASNIVHIG